jgi:hypothetical protein
MSMSEEVLPGMPSELARSVIAASRRSPSPFEKPGDAGSRSASCQMTALAARGAWAATAAERRAKAMTARRRIRERRGSLSFPRRRPASKLKPVSLLRPPLDFSPRYCTTAAHADGSLFL